MLLFLDSTGQCLGSAVSYVSKVPAHTYTDATSSVPIAAHICHVENPTRPQQPPNNLRESADDRPRVSQRFMPMDFDSLNENRRLLRCEVRGPLARGEMRECSEAASLLKGTWGFPFRLAPNSFGKGY